MNDCQLISIAKPLYELCYGWMTLNLHWSWDGLEIVDDGHYYRPQQSCEGYVFTGGWGCLLQCMLWYHPARVNTPPPKNQTPQGQTPPESRHPPDRHPHGRNLPKIRHPPRSRHPPEIWPLLQMVLILLECILVCLSCRFVPRDQKWD